MARDRDNRLELTRKELEGFLQLLCKSDGLPEATEEILAYLERVGMREQLDEERAWEIARKTLRGLLSDRLARASVTPVRPWGVHLAAKRVAANCTAAQVAAVLEVDLTSYERLESGARNPLDETGSFLAEVVRTFGLRISELRESLVKYLERSPPSGEIRFARGGGGQFSREELAIAAEDLQNNGRMKKPIEKNALDRLERKIAEVTALLKA